MFSKKFRNYLRESRIARLATLNKDDTIHIVPIVFANDSSHIYFAIDRKPKKTNKLRRLANIARNASTTILIDSYSEDWSKLSYAIIYGTAEILSSTNNEKKKALRLLKRKYPQYGSGDFLPRNPKSIIVVRLTPGRIVQWSAKPAWKPSLK
ncbi:MAG: TIGR03668 family PPOX class F420-dependent oxidoreductase [archaeon]|nr:TIGR03668 family PPOX class F420-dependent oxidoreductase [archaeon]